MTARIEGAVMGRPSAVALTDRLQRAQLRNSVLRDELAALHAERDGLAVEIRALSARLQLAITADAPLVALQVAGRLDALGVSLQRRGDAA